MGEKPTTATLAGGVIVVVAVVIQALGPTRRTPAEAGAGGAVGPVR
jgi:hypothetical protein